MSLTELLLIAVFLSMDAFAVAVCTGLAAPKRSLRTALIVGLYFGGFQALMPLAGYLLGTGFSDKITQFAHWIAFALLSIIGLKMIWETFKVDHDSCKCEENADSCTVTAALLSPKRMLPLALATSIDAMAAGITFAFFKVNIFIAITLIGVITLLLSVVGVTAGKLVGERFQKNAERIGGLALVLIGLKILLEGIGILPQS